MIFFVIHLVLRTREPDLRNRSLRKADRTLVSPISKKMRVIPKPVGGYSCIILVFLEQQLDISAGSVCSNDAAEKRTE
jgi:hypothetical protein